VRCAALRLAAMSCWFLVVNDRMLKQILLRFRHEITLSVRSVQAIDVILPHYDRTKARSLFEA
jgi:hypothetical protein